MEDTKGFYKKNKNGIIIFTLIISALFVFFQVVKPEIDKIQENMQKVEDTEKKVETLKQTIGVLSSINNDDLDSYYKLTTTSLPQVKDILLVFNEMQAAAQRNSVEIGSLTINLGDIYSKQKKQDKLADGSLGSPSINFTINVDGDVARIRAFSQDLYKSIPVVEITEVGVRNNSGELEAKFFYNPLSNTSVDSDTPAQNFTTAELNLIGTLRSWFDASTVEVQTVSVASQVSPTPSVSPSLSPTISPSATVTISPTQLPALPQSN